MTDPIRTAADALAPLSPEDRERALTLARDLPTEPGYYYAKDRARHSKQIVVEVFQRDGYLFVRFFGESDSRTVRVCTHLDWGPRVPERGQDAYAAAAAAQDAKRWRALCDSLGVYYDTDIEARWAFGEGRDASDFAAAVVVEAIRTVKTEIKT